MLLPTLIYQYAAHMSLPQRYVIFGNSGSGKSTLARKIATQLHLRCIHTDRDIIWRHDAVWTLRPKDQQVQELQRILQESQHTGWTFEAVIPKEHFQCALNQATHYILLDIPLWRCLCNAIRRVWRHYGKSRPDLPESCPERFSLRFLTHWIVYSWIRYNRPAVQKYLVAKQQQDLPVTILSNYKEVEQFLATLI